MSEKNKSLIRESANIPEGLSSPEKDLLQDMETTEYQDHDLELTDEDAPAQGKPMLEDEESQDGCIELTAREESERDLMLEEVSTEEQARLKEEALEELTKPNRKGIIEAMLFISDEPVTVDNIRHVLGTRTKVDDIRDILEELRLEYEKAERGFTLLEVANGYRLATRSQFAHWLNKLYKSKKPRYLSKSSLESLAIIAYRQPIIRADIEAIRGVNVDGVIKTLLDRDLIHIVGKKEIPGRPILYGTTQTFLEYFGLRHLDDMPQLPDIRPEDEEDIRESLRASDHMDEENRGLREEQPIVEDHADTTDDHAPESITL